MLQIEESIANKQFYNKSAMNLLNVIEVIRLQLILFLLDYRFRHHGRLWGSFDAMLSKYRLRNRSLCKW